jgi:MFS superfamily sulfate permease-like transporter
MSHDSQSASLPVQSGVDSSEVPVGNLAGLAKWWKYDLASGFLVFLIALPLCLGISIASGFPPVAGVFTAIIGGLVCPLISNSELTIKGPAAGLIVVVLGAMQGFGYTGGVDPAADYAAYRLVLGVGVAAGVIQIVFGLLRTGVLGEFFPMAAVHGLLASIGIIIASKQIHTVLGVDAPKGGPMEWIAGIPHSLLTLNPEIAVIGVGSLALLFGWAFLPFKALKRIPPQIVVVILAIGAGYLLDLGGDHTYTFAGHHYPMGEKFLVNVPTSLFGAFVTPDFSGVLTGTGLLSIVSFSLIGSLESMLSAKAVELVDPWHRKTDMNRDLTAVGLANTLAACLGGLPMISEIVRSKANADNGARTRFANTAHALCLLVFVAAVPTLIHRIPLAALAAMLVFTGFRLASPKEFINTYRVGSDQLCVFVATVVGVLATDLLIGIGIGVGTKFALHLLRGVPFSALFKSDIDVERQDVDVAIVTVHRAAVFSTWIPLRRKLLRLNDCTHVIVDLEDTFLVDSSVMEKLQELGREFVSQGRCLIVRGLDAHDSVSAHPAASRHKPRVVAPQVSSSANSDSDIEPASAGSDLKG